MKRMNIRQIRMAITLLPLLLFAGCTAGDDGQETLPVPISLTCSQVSVTGVETRAATDAHSTLNSEQVNVYMPGSSIGGTNPIVYTVAASPNTGGESNMTPASTPYLFADRTDVFGFYPTAVTMSAGKVSYSVNEDQSGETNYKLSDLLFGKTEILKPEGTVGNTLAANIEFHHLMSKVIVNVVVDDPDDPTIDVTGIWLVNVNKTLDFTPASYTINHAALTGLSTKDDVGEGASAGVQAGIKVGTASGCAALIPPQEVMGKNFIVVGAQGFDGKAIHYGTVTYAIPNILTNKLTLLPGKTYTFTLKINRWSFGQTMVISVSDWSNSDNPDEIGDPRLSV